MEEKRETWDMYEEKVKNIFRENLGIEKRNTNFDLE